MLLFLWRFLKNTVWYAILYISAHHDMHLCYKLQIICSVMQSALNLLELILYSIVCGKFKTIKPKKDANLICIKDFDGFTTAIFFNIKDGKAAVTLVWIVTLMVWIVNPPKLLWPCVSSYYYLNVNTFGGFI